MKKGLVVILAGVLAVAMGLGGLSVVNNIKNTKSFIADGYILDPSDEETITTNMDAQYFFAQGDSYKEKFGDQIIFKDTSSGDKESLDKNHFVHYNDGSLGSFTKGVIMDITDVSTEETYGYYSLTKNTVLIKNGSSYEMTSRGEAMALTEFIWKISDNDYMLVSPTITLDVGPEEVTFSDYAQITYVDNGIVRISHQTGSYQTVAADSELVTDQGAELNLVGKSFMVDGEPVFSLDDMAIDDDSYIDIDENVPDAPTIPTFNVINGKDGASGSDGEQGVEGEQGEDGEEGEEGEEGSEGAAGGEGTMGSEGAMGEDGVEGGAGAQGYDGAKGIEGVSAENPASSSEYDAVDLNARPEIKMETISGDTDSKAFDISATKASFSLKMTEANDKPAIAKQKTTVTLYDRNTMNPVKTIDYDSDPDFIDSLEKEVGTASLDFENLKPGTEYMLVVSGSYAPDPKSPTSYIDTTFYRKIFTTEGTGISLEKDLVTENSIATHAVISGKVGQYTVVYYYKDADGTKHTLAEFPHSGGGSPLPIGTTEADVLNNDVPSRPSGSSLELLQSNSTYYASLALVKGGTDLTEDVLVEGSEIEFKTLKKAPYQKYKDGGTDKTRPFIESTPSLIANDKDHSLILSLKDIFDDDKGVRKYRYELYAYNDLFQPAAGGGVEPVQDFSSIRPKFTEEKEVLEDVSFAIPSSDTTQYVGRVVAIFDDNEKTRELNSLLSNAVALGASTNDLLVEFKEIQDVEPDTNKIQGVIYIKDVQGIVIPNVNASQPLILTITSPYDDVITQRIESTAQGTFDAANKTWTIPFTQPGLRADTTYSLSVVGPEDSDRDGELQSTELTTHLVGMRTKTSPTSTASFVGWPEVAGASLFSVRAFFAAAPPTATTPAGDPAQVAADNKVKDELKSVRYLTLKLVRVSDGLQIGETVTLTEATAPGYTSNFAEAFVQRTKVETNEDLTLSIKPGVDLSGLHNYTITPSTFKVPDNDSRLTSGGNFQIIVVEAGDYRVGPGKDPAEIDRENANKIPFKPGEDRITFKIEERHTESATPQNEVNVDMITNGDGRESGLDLDTVIGMRFKTRYPLFDVDEIHYYIYEITSSASTADINNKKEIYSDNESGYESSLVLRGSKHIGSAGGYTPDEVELYFNGTQCETTGYTWYDGHGTELPVGTEDDPRPTILERGKRYFIRYEVVVNPEAHARLDCPGKTRPGEGNVYPYCAYAPVDNDNNPISVPWYRSQVIELSKQAPKVERYPYSSDATSETWMYRFNDPDGALITTPSGDAKNLGVNVVQKETYEAFADVTPSGTTNQTFDAISSTFEPQRITGITPGKYYQVEIPYKTLEIASAPKEYIVSDPVLFATCETPNTTDISKLKLEGQAWDASYTDADRSRGDSSLLSAIVNQGNYRYRLTLQGNDISKIAALRIKLKYKDTPADTTEKEVIYDPVYLETVGGEASKYAYAYFETSAIADLKDKNILGVDVYPYYAASNGFGEVDAYVAQDTYANNSFGDSKLIALRTYEGASTEYKRLFDDNLSAVPYPATARLNYSLFVPVKLQVNGTSGNSIQQKYTYNPLIMSKNNQAASFVNNMLPISFNETGMLSGTSYYNVQTLALSENRISFTYPQDEQFTIGESMPAIDHINTSEGAVTATMRMELLGTLASDANPQVYPMVFKLKSGSTTEYDLVKLIPHTVEGTLYYDVECITDDGTKRNKTYDRTTTNETALYGSASGLSPMQVLPPVNGKVYSELRLRDLDSNSKYVVKYYTFNDDVITFLYSKTPNRVGVEYEINTKDKITLGLTDPSYQYSTYEDKKASFKYWISGVDGDYTIITYKLLDKEGNTIIDETIVPPLGNNILWNYSSTADENNPFTIDMTPSSGPLIVGQKYDVFLQIYDTKEIGYNPSIDQLKALTNRGELMKEIGPVPALAQPNLSIRDAYYTDGKIRVNVSLGDANRATLNDKIYYEVTDDNDPSWSVRKEGSLGDRTADSVLIYGSIDLGGHSSSSYSVKVSLDYDTQNNRTSDGSLEAVLNNIAGEESPSAEVEFDATESELVVSLHNVKNFSNVKSISVTVYDMDDNHKYTGTKTYADSMTFNWSNVKSGNKYYISVYFETDSKTYKGGTQIVTVK